jgi:hypothetical protein
MPNPAKGSGIEAKTSGIETLQKKPMVATLRVGCHPLWDRRGKGLIQDATLLEQSKKQLSMHRGTGRWGENPTVATSG